LRQADPEFMVSPRKDKKTVFQKQNKHRRIQSIAQMLKPFYKKTKNR
jgi:hypothetical protein